MHAKVTPMNEKHFEFSSWVHNKIGKNKWDRVGASRYADFNDMMHSDLVQLQGRLSRSTNKIPMIILL